MIMMTSYFHNLFSVLGEPDSDITCKELSSGNGYDLNPVSVGGGYHGPPFAKLAPVLQGLHFE